jgi:adenine specific DNA methylase Mod
VDGINPTDIIPNNGRYTLVDMGYVNGNIQGKKLHCYYVVYGAEIGTRMDHIYILEGSDGNLSIQQPEAKSYKSITVITDTDTFRLKK